MLAEYDGRQIVGIDLHRRRSVIVRMTEAGDQLGCVRIDNDPVTLAAEIAKAGEHPDVVLEATYGWYWAVDVLQEAGARVHLAHPLGVKGFAYRRVKNDQRDASDLADLLRMNRLPQAYVAPPAVFVAEIGEAGRFTDAAHLASWAGLTPKHRESDRTVRRGPITKQGSGLVRWAAVEAAQKIPASAGWLVSSRARITERRGRNIATVAVARKLLTLVYYGLRDGHIRALTRAQAAA